MKRMWISTLILSIILVIILITIFIFRNNIFLKLNGEVVNTIYVNTEFIDEGIEASLFNRDISDKVKISTDLDVNKIGEYYINYKLYFLKQNYNLTRKVLVIDKDNPYIELNGEKEINLYVGDNYIEQGAIAIDNYDGDITSNIVVSGDVNINNAGTYEVKYSITDSSGNESNIIRKVIVNKKENSVPSVTYNCMKYNDNYNSEDAIIKYIEDNNYKVSIGYYNLVNGKTYFYQANKVYYGASLIKTLSVLYLYDNGLVNINLEPYIDKSISVSDNDAYEYLVSYIGREKLKDYGFKLGACNTLTINGNYGNTTVVDQIIYLKKLYEISKNDRKLQSYFINGYGNYLNFDDIGIMHKYGFYGLYYHDVGIVLDEQPYLVVILTEHGADNVDNRYEIINNISKLIFDYHNLNK